jgi:hypothetical protein
MASRSLYSVFAAEGLRQGKSLEDIGRAWRESHGGRRSNPYTPEGTHRKTRNDNLAAGLRAGLSFEEARRRAEMGENPYAVKRAGGPYPVAKFDDYEDAKRFVKEHQKEYLEAKKRDYRTGGRLRVESINPSLDIPGLDWLEDHWMAAAVGLAATGIVIAAKSINKKHVSCSSCAGAPAMQPAAITAATAVATDNSQYSGEASRGGPGPQNMSATGSAGACQGGRLAKDGRCWHPRGGGSGWWSHNPGTAPNAAGIGLYADSGLRYANGEPQW